MSRYAFEDHEPRIDPSANVHPDAVTRPARQVTGG